MLACRLSRILRVSILSGKLGIVIPHDPLCDMDDAVIPHGTLYDTVPCINTVLFSVSY
jgi:hypothetical protein